MGTSDEPTPRRALLSFLARSLAGLVLGSDDDLEHVLAEGELDDAAGGAQPRPPVPAHAHPKRARRPRAPEVVPLPFDWVTIPSGFFYMGSDPALDLDALETEQPQCRLSTPHFHISRVPVTEAQFAVFLRATGYRTTAEEAGWAWVWTSGEWMPRRDASWQYPIGPGRAIADLSHCPVTQVSWHDAQAFCQWAGVSLPTEIEWERAARGGDARLYPWGNRPPDATLCHWDDPNGELDPVGKRRSGASPFGVLDMGGNVWEWCLTKWRPNYSTPPDDDPSGQEPRVVRGGSYIGDAGFVRCATRGRLNSHYRDCSVGFRVVARRHFGQEASGFP
jgi:formylglycine-generating enzyme required for sulfatase activity